MFLGKLKRVFNFIQKYIYLFAFSSFVLVFFAFYFTFKLSIDTNQIQLLPQDYPNIKQTNRLIKMIGGNGFYVISIKFKDEKGMGSHLKKAFAFKKEGKQKLFQEEFEKAYKVQSENLEYYEEKELFIKKTADEIAKILKNQENIRYIYYKHSNEFLQEKLLFLLENADLKEINEIAKEKIELEIEKANPFYMPLLEEEEPNFDDVLEKYQKLAQRDIFDDYNISKDKGMVLMFLKPKGNVTDINFISNFDDQIRGKIQSLNLDKKGIIVDYTGTYKLARDDYESLVGSLKPISIISLIAISLLLIFFFKNPYIIFILMISLVSGIALTFGTSYFILGRLNSISSMMASVLMGLGVDYGIQFFYRFREEFSNKEDVVYAISQTFYNTGRASLTSAFTTASAFFVLAFSDFKGFSEFGIIACYGIFIIAISMYIFTSLQVLLILKLFPNAKKIFLSKNESKKENLQLKKIFFHYKKLLNYGLVTFLFISIFAIWVKFNYNGQDLSIEGQKSLLINDEIIDRFEVIADPQVAVLDSLEESEALYDFLNPPPKNYDSIFQQAFSIWNVVPPRAQQLANKELIKEISQDPVLEKRGLIPEEYREYLPILDKMLVSTPYHIEDVPYDLRETFREVPESEEKGSLVYIYPNTSLRDGKKLLEFHKYFGKLSYPKISRRTLSEVLYAQTGELKLKQEFTKGEKEVILKALNEKDENYFKSIQLLPKTVKAIFEGRPFNKWEDIGENKYETYLAGAAVLYANLIKIVQREGLLSVFITLIIIFSLLALSYRNIKSAIFSVFPIILGISTMLGLMSIFNVELNFMNILIFPIVLGYGIQNTIYIYYRYKEESDIVQTMTKTGFAVLASSLTTLIGWAALMISQHRGLQSIGIVSSIGIFSVLIISLTIVPSFIVLISKKNENA